jgi:hypothetical protein
MKRFTSFISQLTLASLLTLVWPLVVVAAPAQAAPQDENSSQALCEGAGGTWNRGDNTCNRTGTRAFPDVLSSITDLLLFIVGAIAVIVIIVGGVRYVTSGGDQTAVTSAKNTILYAVIGLVVAFMAYAIVKFVVGQF